MTTHQSDAAQPNDESKVMQVIEEYVFQNHRFPSKAQTAELAQIDDRKCKAVVERLKQQKRLSSVFGGGRGLPEVLLPYEMMQGVIMAQKKPNWVVAYGFAEKEKLESKRRELYDQTLKYDMFERLLYGTDVPLEEAVEFTLRWLGFANVVWHEKTKDYADVTFEYNSTKALVEIEGTAKQGDKSKVLQLEGWMRIEIEKGERDSSAIQGFLVVNHFRHEDPQSRGDPLTDQAKKFLGHYHFRFFTSYHLFDIVRRVDRGEMNKNEAQQLLWEGEQQS